MIDKPKQVFALETNILLIFEKMQVVEKYYPDLWTYSSTVIKLSDVPNQIIEEQQPFQIKVRGDPEPYGYLNLEETRYGVLISYNASNAERWSIVDRYMQKLLVLLEQEGVKLHSFERESYPVIINQIEKIYKNKGSLSPEALARLDRDATNGCDECNKLIPQREKDLERWQDAYQIIINMLEEYKTQYNDDECEKPIPTLKEIRDRIMAEMFWDPCIKTIRKIKRAGEKGCLD